MIQVVVIAILVLTALVTTPFKGNDSFLALINPSSQDTKKLKEISFPKVSPTVSPGVTGAKSIKFRVSPTLAPSLSPLSPIGVTKKLVSELVSPIPLVTFSSFPVSNAQIIILSPSVSPKYSSSPKPIASIAVNLSPSPSTVSIYSPSPVLVPTVMVSPSLSPSVSPTPSPSEVVTPVVTPSVSMAPAPTEYNSLPGRKVLINEIAWMGTDNSANDEWLELYNPGNEAVDLTGWTLKSQDGTPNIVFGEKSIAPGGYFLLERTDDSTIPNISADQIYTGALGNSGEYLELRNKEGDLVDFVPASGDWVHGDNAAKAPMARLNSLPAGNDLSNWTTGIVGGTPRAGNAASP